MIWALQMIMIVRELLDKYKSENVRKRQKCRLLYDGWLLTIICIAVP